VQVHKSQKKNAPVALSTEVLVTAVKYYLAIKVSEGQLGLATTDVLLHWPGARWLAGEPAWRL
jgi:hypothetical protein